MGDGGVNNLVKHISFVLTEKETKSELRLREPLPPPLFPSIIIIIKTTWGEEERTYKKERGWGEWCELGVSWLINHIHFSFFFLAETDGRRRIWFYHSGNGGGGWVMDGCHGCSLKGEEE